MSDDAYEPMGHIDWNLIDRDHTIEWLVHLCEVFNRGEESDNWNTWPEDFLWHPHQTTIPEDHRRMWLHVVALICQNPGITVSGNDVFVTGRFSTEFKFEMTPDHSDWVGIEHPRGDDCVPKELGSDIGNYVPETISLCWDCPEDIPTPVELYSLILALLDETKVWEYLLDWLFVECWLCRENRPMHRQDFETVGWMHSDENPLATPTYSRLLGIHDNRPRPSGPYYCCYWCGPNAPDHH